MDNIDVLNNRRERHGAGRWLLVGAGVLYSLVFGRALAAFPLAALYAERHVNLTKLGQSIPLLGLWLAGAVLLLMAGFAAGYRALARGEPGRGSLAAVALFPAIFCALLLWVQPITSVDIYDYLFRGRMLTHYGANPFTAIPEQHSADRLILMIGWRRAVTAYGPLWELLSAPVSALAGGNLLRLMLGYKLLALASYALCGAALWLLSAGRSRAERLRRLYLWLWNPLVLWEIAGAGHNDGWMALFLIIAALALGAPRPRLALLALVAGALFKFIPALLIPVALAYELGRLRLSRSAESSAPSGHGESRGGVSLPKQSSVMPEDLPWKGARTTYVTSALLARQTIQGLTLGGALAVAAYAPFWAGRATFNNVLERQELWYGSPFALARLLIDEWTDWPLDWLPRVALLLLAAAVIAVMVVAYRRAPESPALFIGALGLFLLCANPWFQPWYAIWVAAMAACLTAAGALGRAAAVFGATALLSYVLEPFVLPALGWDAKGIPWNTLLVMLIYLPPLVALLPLGRTQPAPAPGPMILPILPRLEE